MLTAERKQKFLAAIGLAREPGGCLYVRNGEPCCVIAQLAVLEGVPVSVMVEWDRARNTIWHVAQEGKLPVELHGYPRELLSSVQGRWDVSIPDDQTDEDRRVEMRALVQGATPTDSGPS